MLHRSLVLLALLLGGCSARDGDILARVLQRTSQKIETAVGNAPGQFAARIRVPVVPMGPAERVHKRLVWDRYLEGIQVQVDSPAEGVVRLRGHIKELATRQRIVDLTRTTIGVQEVQDELTLAKDE